MIKQVLAHPLTRGLDIDSPHTTQLRRQIIQEKSFLRQIYLEWYALIAGVLPQFSNPMLELGSGAGFLSEFVSPLITSEIFCCSGVDTVLDGMALPLRDSTLSGIVLIDVLHHVPQPRRFLSEAARCVLPGGVLVMIEPWVTSWSRLIYTHLHHEPFQPDVSTWEFPRQGPLSGANGALPYIIFARDRIEFEREFPQWRIERIIPMMPFCYLVSGGVSLRSLMPGFSFKAWRFLENLLQPWLNHLAMFALIVLNRV